jgi:DNA repair exonuclease SbcCD ATPase subunit
MYKVLCNHPYFDDLRIDIKPQLLSGIERNNYMIRSFASTDGRETLASSRLSTAQMNCVALSVYLALATQLQHNLGFIIMDDPSQNLDSTHKAALVSVLSHLAPGLQLLVGTQDTEFDELLGKAMDEKGFERYGLAWSPRRRVTIVPQSA